MEGEWWVDQVRERLAVFGHGGVCGVWAVSMNWCRVSEVGNLRLGCVDHRMRESESRSMW